MFFAAAFYLPYPINLIYKISRLYGENEEEGVIWNDPTLNIEWPCLDPRVSKKDQSNKLVSQIEQITDYSERKKNLENEKVRIVNNYSKTK